MSADYEARRALNATIRSRVFGWTLDPSRCGICGGTGCAPVCTAPWPRRRYDEAPHYATSMSSAWLIVEKMRADGWGFELQLADDSGPEVAFGAAFGKTLMAESAFTWSDTAPHVICLAALAALDAP